MKRTLILCLGAAFLGGCAAFHKMDSTEAAIKAGRIEGLSPTNGEVMIYTTWSWPGKFLGPYSKVAGLPGYAAKGTNTGPPYVFFLGKSRERKAWEVFAAMVWEDGKWKPVPVKLPESRTP